MNRYDYDYPDNRNTRIKRGTNRRILDEHRRTSDEPVIREQHGYGAPVEGMVPLPARVWVTIL
jgi:hypothetical protein